MLRAWCSRGAVALLIALAAFVHRPAQAAISASCVDLRNNIATMEKNVPSGAALTVDIELRRVYVVDCLEHPNGGKTPGSAATDPWFDTKGDPASGPPPGGNGVFQTTQEIAEYCHGNFDPQLCALLLNLGEGQMLAEGGDPDDPDDWREPKRTIDPADELPPLQLSAGGETFAVDGACLGALAGLLFARSGEAPSGLAASLVASIGGNSECASQLNPIRPKLAAFREAIPRWRKTALRDPGFVAMCGQAYGNENICLARQQSMRTAGSDADVGNSGQAGAFGDCAQLYGSVVAMCRESGYRYPSKLRNKLKDVLAQPNDDKPAMSDQCRGLVQNLVTAAKANDGPAAKAGYDALQHAGGCGVLPADAQSPQPDPRFMSRGDTPMLDQTFGACDQQPERCNQIANQLKASTSPAATAALYANAIGVGLQLGAEMAQGLAAAQQLNARAPSMPSGSSTNYNSLGGPIIRNGVGQGAPRQPTPPTYTNGCIECRTGSAQ